MSSKSSFRRFVSRWLFAYLASFAAVSLSADVARSRRDILGQSHALHVIRHLTPQDVALDPREGDTKIEKIQRKTEIEQRTVTAAHQRDLEESPPESSGARDRAKCEGLRVCPNFKQYQLFYISIEYEKNTTQG
ncbi:hypothetical protein [Aliiruegeria lutimaris]|uniref:hypothetical protein n=1 Tax=Aliiruegeria lutimaris TaxID=571298 RepID=UPI0011142376|nr:hypothetical protein [Aliiruegeria lutimaris]